MRSEATLARPQTEPWRALTPEERTLLEQVARSQSERADRVRRARAVLALADGASFTAAAARVGFRSARGVAKLVTRFHRQGWSAIAGGHGGGNPVQYGPAEQERILQEVRRTPDPEQDGTANWSLSTLQGALRRAPDGFPAISTFRVA